MLSAVTTEHGFKTVIAGIDKNFRALAGDGPIRIRLRLYADFL